MTLRTSQISQPRRGIVHTPTEALFILPCYHHLTMHMLYYPCADGFSRSIQLLDSKHNLIAFPRD